MKIFMVLAVCIVFKSEGQSPKIKMPEFECNYVTLFNYSLDNGDDIRRFESSLIILDRSSFFYAVPAIGTFSDTDVDERHLVIKKDTLFKVIKFTDKNVIVFKDDVFAKKGKLYQDTLFPMHWEITGEERTIDSLKCVKASATFKGRNYVAWYCPDIPIPDGPWKLGGLPGLIIEAYDEARQLQFILKSFKPLSCPENFTNVFTCCNLSAIPGYPLYIRSGNTFIKKFKEQMNARTIDCLECQTSSKVEFHNLENVFR